eukprot:COSAG02_NODE_8497_length_2549_cov_2.334286_4_plen_81_part_01
MQAELLMTPTTELPYRLSKRRKNLINPKESYREAGLIQNECCCFRGELGQEWFGELTGKPGREGNCSERQQRCRHRLRQHV